MNSIYLFLKVALLAFYPDNTKISIDDNTVTIRKPGITQGILRWTFGESRNDILIIKEHIENALYVFRNNNFVIANSIILCMCKALKKLKLCYIESQDIRECLSMLETNVIHFNNKKGKVDAVTLTCENSKINQILGDWKLSDIKFLNLNIMCIFELEKYNNTDYKQELKDSYLKTIDDYTTHVNNK